MTVLILEEGSSSEKMAYYPMGAKILHPSSEKRTKVKDSFRLPLLHILSMMSHRNLLKMNLTKNVAQHGIDKLPEQKCESYFIDFATASASI